MEQWCTRRICLQNQNSQKNYGRKGRHPSLGTEGLLKLRYINVLKFEKSQIFFVVCNSTLPPLHDYHRDNQAFASGGITGEIWVELHEVPPIIPP